MGTAGEEETITNVCVIHVIETTAAMSKSKLFYLQKDIEIQYKPYFPSAITTLMILYTYCLEVVCIVYFFGHKIVHIC